ncbi:MULTISPECIES: hypothetical protein [unclassified Okeania]|uniref:hypothetical protein n=1 Tax=unclassified Okeania TaxID=2634635 RepID=UPI0013BA3AB7|nr:MULTISPECIES: hypothetical protein [unclassified Okeania]NES74489.1 hypothetical protein [Okeania sp. SIO1H4]NET20909.1 hypothetical protein [Okeania sp. SIO1H5]NET75804.1 hypothetical protein [Okeania sp. SIO1F9]NET94023.1 hypothetical protein [Okeania sp. SIO1H2]
MWLIIGNRELSFGKLAFAIAMRSMIAPGQTFEKLWQVIQFWHSFWYVTDGDRVYPKYSNERSGIYNVQLKVQ